MDDRIEYWSPLLKIKDFFTLLFILLSIYGIIAATSVFVVTEESRLTASMKRLEEQDPALDALFSVERVSNEQYVIEVRDQASLADRSVLSWHISPSAGGPLISLILSESVASSEPVTKVVVTVKNDGGAESGRIVVDVPEGVDVDGEGWEIFGSGAGREAILPSLNPDHTTELVLSGSALSEFSLGDIDLNESRSVFKEQWTSFLAISLALFLSIATFVWDIRSGRQLRNVRPSANDNDRDLTGPSPR